MSRVRNTLAALSALCVVGVTPTANAEPAPAPCWKVTSYPLAMMPAPWTPQRLCEASEALLDPEPVEDGTL